MAYKKKEVNSPVTTPIHGAKSAKTFLTERFKKGVWRILLRVLATINVIRVTKVDTKAFRPDTAGLLKFLAISLKASTMKITDINELDDKNKSCIRLNYIVFCNELNVILNLKMSSVNLVKYSTTFEVEKIEDRNKINDDHSPTQEYTGKKGKFIFKQVSYKTFKKASKGPVVPIIVNGCPENNA